MTPDAPTAPQPFRDAARFWEPRRLWYNLALTAQVAAWLVLTWPHFRPAMTFANLARLLVLAALANLCYSAAYLADLTVLQASAGAARRRQRSALWLVGTLCALLFACHWIGDEIYPYVTGG